MSKSKFYADYTYDSGEGVNSNGDDGIIEFDLIKIKACTWFQAKKYAKRKLIDGCFLQKYSGYDFIKQRYLREFRNSYEF
jgi:hypothetical protein